MSGSYKYEDKIIKNYVKVGIVLFIIFIITLTLSFILTIQLMTLYVSLSFSIASTIMIILCAISARRSSGMLYEKGKKAFLSGDFKVAFQYAQDAIKMNPDNPFYWNALGLSYSEKKEHKKAIEAYLKGLELNSQCHKGLQKRVYIKNVSINLCYEYIVIKNYTQALETLKKTLGLFNNDTIVYSHLGHAYILLGKFEKAIEASIRAIEIDPSNAKALSVLGFAYYNSNEPEKGLENLNKAVKVNPNHPRAYYYLVKIYYDKGNYEAALKECEKALKLDPNLIEALDLRNKIKSEK